MLAARRANNRRAVLDPDDAAAGEDPIGRFLQADLWRHEREVPAVAIGKPREIVGIVGDHQEFSVRAHSPYRPPSAGRSRYIYVPHTQHPTGYLSRGRANKLHNGKELVLRTTLEPMSLAADVRRIVAEIDANVAVVNLQTMEARLDQTVTSERF